MSQISDYFAPLETLIPFLVLGVASFEVQRWVKNVLRGRRGRSDFFVALLFVTNLAAIAGTFSAIVVWIWQSSWVFAVTAYLLRLPLNVVYTIIVRTIVGFLRIDFFLLSVLGFLAVWPILFWLAFALYTTYF